MKLRVATLITLATAVAAISLPIVLSLHVAERQGQETESLRALAYAHDVLKRSEETAQQLHTSIGKLVAVGGEDPCSDAHITVMREQDLASSYIQAIGHVKDDQWVCSSLGQALGPLSLGKADLVTRLGVKTWVDVAIPFAPGTTFTVFEKHGFAAIINKQLPIDIVTKTPDTSLIAFSEGRVIFSKGHLKPD